MAGWMGWESRNGWGGPDATGSPLTTRHARGKGGRRSVLRPSEPSEPSGAHRWPSIRPQCKPHCTTCHCSSTTWAAQGCRIPNSHPCKTCKFQQRHMPSAPAKHASVIQQIQSATTRAAAVYRPPTRDVRRQRLILQQCEGHVLAHHRHAAVLVRQLAVLQQRRVRTISRHAFTLRILKLHEHASPCFVLKARACQGPGAHTQGPPAARQAGMQSAGAFSTPQRSTQPGGLPAARPAARAARASQARPARPRQSPQTGAPSTSWQPAGARAGGWAGRERCCVGKPGPGGRGVATKQASVRRRDGSCCVVPRGPRPRLGTSMANTSCSGGLPRHLPATAPPWQRPCSRSSCRWGSCRRRGGLLGRTGEGASSEACGWVSRRKGIKLTASKGQGHGSVLAGAGSHETRHPPPRTKQALLLNFRWRGSPSRCTCRRNCWQAAAHPTRRAPPQ